MLYRMRDIHSMSSIWIKIGRFVFVKRSSDCTHIFKLPRWWTSSPSPHHTYFHCHRLQILYPISIVCSLIHFACAYSFFYYLAIAIYWTHVFEWCAILSASNFNISSIHFMWWWCCYYYCWCCCCFCFRRRYCHCRNARQQQPSHQVHKRMHLKTY